MPEAMENAAELRYGEKALTPGAPEAEELAGRLLTTLAELWYAERGYAPGTIEIVMKG